MYLHIPEYFVIYVTAFCFALQFPHLIGTRSVLNRSMLGEMTNTHQMVRGHHNITII
jgi:hypothetical protein